MNWDHVITGLLFIIAYCLGEESERRSAKKRAQKRLPHAWTCPVAGCKFTVQSSEYSVMDEIKVSHDYYHMKEAL